MDEETEVLKSEQFIQITQLIWAKLEFSFKTAWLPQFPMWQGLLCKVRYSQIDLVTIPGG